MSFELTSQKAQRDPLDRHYTAPWMTRALLEALPLADLIQDPRPVLEPCSGEGGITDVLRSIGLRVETADADPSVSVDHHGDFINDVASGLHGDLSDHPSGGLYSAVISNPPFKTPDWVATDFVEAALSICDRVMMLLRLNWMEPCETRDRRGRIFAERPPNQILVLPRGSFRAPGTTRPGTDKSCCAWFVWSDFDVPPQTSTGWVGQHEIPRLSGQGVLL